jgi:predicted amidohydrolase YtcJ
MPRVRQPSTGISASLLLLNGRVLTMAGATAQALAVSGDRVIATGDDRDLLHLRGPKTAIIDLGGRLAMPGFTDSHVHLRALGHVLTRLDLSPAHTLSAALKLIAARAGRTPAGEWITGGGFDKNRWGDSFPDRGDLDRVAPDHPVALHTRDGHSVWLNSLALRRCSITRETQAPNGGVIARDAAGDPTGILQESATSLIYNCPDLQARGAADGELLAGMRSLLRSGITSVHAMEESETFSSLQKLREAGRLPLRVTLYRSRGDLDSLIAAGIRSGFGDEWLRIGGLKLLIDGSLGSQTAWMFQPYENAAHAANSCGVPVLYGEELRETVRRAAAAGLACAIHAIGDRANAEALDALERARDLPTPLPHRIEHAQLLRPADIPRFARLKVVASMQPCHILGDVGTAERYWGARSRWAYPIRSLLRVGGNVIFGSDAPVETHDVMAGVYAAVRRQTLDGRPADGWYREEEGISRQAALRAYTTAPARATGESRLKGALAPGYLADIVVLSENVLRVGPHRLFKPRVELVIVGGRVRYRRRGSMASMEATSASQDRHVAEVLARAIVTSPGTVKVTRADLHAVMRDGELLGPDY